MAIGDLDPLVPGDSDLLSEGPTHIREIKESLVDTFGDWPVGVAYDNVHQKSTYVPASFSQVGTELNLPGSGPSSVAILTGDSYPGSENNNLSNPVVVLMDSTLDTVTAYNWDADTLSFSVNAATPLSIAGAGYGNIANLDGYYMAMAGENIGLSVIGVNSGVAITQVAATLNGLTLTNPAVEKCPASGGNFRAIVFNGGSPGALTCYNTDLISAFAQVGNPISVSNATYTSISYMGAVPDTAPQKYRFVVGYGPTNGSRFRIVDWDGTDFTWVTNEYVGDTGGEIDVQALNLTDFLVVTTTRGIRLYRHSGNTVSIIGKTSYIPSVGAGSQPTIDAYNASDFVYFDMTTADLRTMRINYFPSYLLTAVP